MWVQSLGGEGPLADGMAARSSLLAYSACMLRSFRHAQSLVVSDSLQPHGEGALTLPCIVQKHPWVPHTARRGA